MKIYLVMRKRNARLDSYEDWRDYCDQEFVIYKGFKNKRKAKIFVEHKKSKNNKWDYLIKEMKING